MKKYIIRFSGLPGGIRNNLLLTLAVVREWMEEDEGDERKHHCYVLEDGKKDCKIW
jgi:hypothetical protein